MKYYSKRHHERISRRNGLKALLVILGQFMLIGAMIYVVIVAAILTQGLPW